MKTMKKQYTRKQIVESINYWKKQLKAGNYRKVNEANTAGRLVAGLQPSPFYHREWETWLGGGQNPPTEEQAKAANERLARIVADCANGYKALTSDMMVPRVKGWPETQRTAPWMVTDVDIPNGIHSILDNTFYGYYYLQRVSFPRSLRKICPGAFRECAFLKDLEFPYGLESIEASAFKDCRGLRRVIVPSSVCRIYANAFSGCPNAMVFFNGRTREQVEAMKYYPWGLNDAQIVCDGE